MIDWTTWLLVDALLLVLSATAIIAAFLSALWRQRDPDQRRRIR